MTIRLILIHGVFGLILILAITFLTRGIESRQQIQITEEICHTNSNNLEMGFVRESLEGLERGIARSAFQDSCLRLMLNGRSYGAPCEKPGTEYIVTRCQLTGNRSISAEILYIDRPLFGPLQFGAWAIVTLLLLALSQAARFLSRYAISELSTQLENDLFGRANEIKQPPLRGSIVAAFSLLVRRELGLERAINLQIATFEERMSAYERQIRALEQASALAQIAAQVSHDIRSPLATLLAALQTAQGLDEPSRVQIRGAVNRIRDIANGLLANNRAQRKPGPSAQSLEVLSQPNEPRSLEHLATLVEVAVSEKRIQFRTRSEVEIEFVLDPDAFGAFGVVQPGDLSRMVSNLVNNAVEAMDGGGRIIVRLAASEAGAVLQVIDTGKGIPAELLSKVVERGGTFGKKDGNGLGLSHTKATVESWGGTFHLDSTLGAGTTITLNIPTSEAPRWFVSAVTLAPGATVIILDDDPGIHALWEGRFSKVEPKPTLLHFHSSAEILEWFRKSLGMVENRLYLCDYELEGSVHNGLEVMEMLGITQEAILVTSRSEEPELREKCLRKGVRILPKQLAALVRIGFDDQK